MLNIQVNAPVRTYGRDKLDKLVEQIIETFGGVPALKLTFDATQVKAKFDANVAHFLQREPVGLKDHREMRRRVNEAAIIGNNVLDLTISTIKGDFDTFLNGIVADFKDLFGRVDVAEWQLIYDKLVAEGSIKAAVDLAKLETQARINNERAGAVIEQQYALLERTIELSTTNELNTLELNGAVAIANDAVNNDVNLESSVVRAAETNKATTRGQLDIDLAQLDAKNEKAVTDVDTQNIRQTTVVEIEGIKSANQADIENINLVAAVENGNISVTTALRIANKQAVAQSKLSASAALTALSINTDAALVNASIASDASIAAIENQNVVTEANADAANQIALVTANANADIAIAAFEQAAKVGTQGITLNGRRQIRQAELLADAQVSQARIVGESAIADSRIQSGNLAAQSEVLSISNDAALSIQAAQIRSGLSLAAEVDRATARQNSDRELSRLRITSQASITAENLLAQSVKTGLINSSVTTATSRRITDIRARASLNAEFIRSEVIKSTGAALRKADSNNKLVVTTAEAETKIAGKLAELKREGDDFTNDHENKNSLLIAKANQIRVVNEAYIEEVIDDSALAAYNDVAETVARANGTKTIITWGNSTALDLNSFITF